MGTPDLIYATNPLLREAVAARGSNCTLKIIPLSGGHFAIFAQNSEIITILDQAPNSDELRTLSLEAESKMKAWLALGVNNKESQGPPSKKAQRTITLDDLDLSL